jgi:hypothetical protein
LRENIDAESDLTHRGQSVALLTFVVGFKPHLDFSFRVRGAFEAANFHAAINFGGVMAPYMWSMGLHAI